MNTPASTRPEIEWVDSLPPSKRAPALRPLFAALKGNLGVWARIESPDTKKAGSRAQYLRKQGFEATARTIDGQAYVYARYVGDGK